MQDSLVSVIIPVYNVEDYLDRCVRSILDQTYSNTEILLVDDGSTDNCPEKCDTYAQADSRVTVIHKPNGGLSDARNTGLEKANGEFIMFLDSDDWVAPDIIETLIALLFEYSADIAECSYANVYARKTKPVTKCTGGVIVVPPVQSLSYMLQHRVFLPTAWGKLYRTDVMKGITFPIDRLHEDEFTVYKYHLNAEKLVYIDRALYYYYQTRTDSIMQQKYRLERLDACDAFRERLYRFWELNLTELDTQMSNAYFLVLVENLYKCWRNKLKGTRLEEAITNALTDYAEIRRRKIKIEQRYIKALNKLELVLDSFGRHWHIRYGGAVQQLMISATRTLRKRNAK